MHFHLLESGVLGQAQAGQIRSRSFGNPENPDRIFILPAACRAGICNQYAGSVKEAPAGPMPAWSSNLVARPSSHSTGRIRSGHIQHKAIPGQNRR